MTMQHWWTASNTTAFPQFTFGWGGGATAPQLRRIYFDTAAGMLLGLFILDSQDTYLGTYWYGLRAQLHRIWRDGTLLQLGSTTRQVGFAAHGGEDKRVMQTTDGRVVRAVTTPGEFSWDTEWEDILTTADTGVWYYQVNPVWPSDMYVPGRIIAASHCEPSHVGYVKPATSAGSALAYVWDTSAGLWNRQLVRQPSGVILFSWVNSITWSNPKDLIYIDASTSIATFSPLNSANAIDYTNGAVVVVFDTTTEPWTELWRDRLPSTDHLATWDPTNRILYSTGLRSATATLHASWLKRTPTSVASASIIGTASGLAELAATRLSTIVQNEMGQVISNVLVQWTLDSATSQGILASHYSRTNNQGIASITYVGPYSPPSNLLEHINVTVATVDLNG